MLRQVILKHQTLGRMTGGCDGHCKPDELEDLKDIFAKITELEGIRKKKSLELFISSQKDFFIFIQRTVADGPT